MKLILEDGSPQVVNSDPVRVRQIVSNLIGNAVKFTAQGTIEVRLHRSEDRLIRLEIADSGIGLNKEQQSVLFLDFSQGDISHTRQYGGTGLGLALSRKLARLLGGDVHLLKSQPGVGSVFEITIESNLVSGSSQPISDTDKTPLTLKLNPNIKILLVEDSPDNVMLVMTYLKNLGATIIVANDGTEALPIVKDQKFDVVLMDLQMPNMDGFEATRQIREMGIQTPIIALTAHALGEHRERALSTGFTHFLSKPIRRELLLRTIDLAINQS